MMVKRMLSNNGDSLTMNVPVKYDDLLAAHQWVSASSLDDNEAFVSRVTGAIHLTSRLIDVNDELPEDIEDENKYVSVPHKQDLDLGRSLVFSFVENNLADSFETVSSFFHQRGAYRRFKDLLEQKGQLEAWYGYETKATELALREWSAEQGLTLAD